MLPRPCLYAYLPLNYGWIRHYTPIHFNKRASDAAVVGVGAPAAGKVKAEFMYMYL